MITRLQMRNAERIAKLAETFGHLPFNSAGQTPNEALNLSIPCARLVVHGIVTGVQKDDPDGVSDSAVEAVEHTCRAAVRYAEAKWGVGWYSASARQLRL
jgi:hypothetical protein